MYRKCYTPAQSFRKDYFNGDDYTIQETFRNHLEYSTIESFVKDIEVVELPLKEEDIFFEYIPLQFIIVSEHELSFDQYMQVACWIQHSYSVWETLEG